MGWLIKCIEHPEDHETEAKNIVELLDEHRDDMGWFLCAHCGSAGYIAKSYDLQEKGWTWDPLLRGAIRIEHDPQDPCYQPYVFLISHTATEQPSDVRCGSATTRTLALSTEAG